MILFFLTFRIHPPSYLPEWFMPPVHLAEMIVIQLLFLSHQDAMKRFSNESWQLTGKKVLGCRAKVPVSFMQLPDAVLNGHLGGRGEKWCPLIMYSKGQLKQCILFGKIFWASNAGTLKRSFITLVLISAYCRWLPRLIFTKSRPNKKDLLP